MSRPSAEAGQPQQIGQRAQQIETGARQLLEILHEYERREVSRTALEIARGQLSLALRPLAEWKPVPGLEPRP